MTNEPKALKEIHDIREKIYEETKNMTPEERANHAHNEAQKIIKKYNLKNKYENKILA
jgi:shikimate kinase